MAKGKRKKREDSLLESYWKYALGTMFKEVPVGECRGRMPRRPRKIDGVRLDHPVAEIKPFSGNANDFRALIAKVRKAEVVEVKFALNRGVIGQAIVGKYLLEMEYPESKASAIVVCRRRNPALQAVCKELKVKVWTPKRKFVVH